MLMPNLGLKFLVCFLGLTLAAAAKSPFAGTWKGTTNNQSGVDLLIEDTSGKISGTVVFYFQLRDKAFPR
jgi:hypothetical protein